MQQDYDDIIINQWSQTAKWTVAGFEPATIDARIPIVWLLWFVLPAIFFWPAVLITVYLLSAKVLKIPPRMLPRYIINRLRGKRLAAMPKRYVRGLLPLVLGAVLLSPVSSADAAFSVVVPEAAGDAKADSEPQGPQSLDDVIEGFGHDVRLKDGVRALLPPGWKPVFKPSSLGNKNVHWRANERTVREILADIANQAGARFTVDDNAGIIAFSPLPTGMRMTAAGMVRDRSTKRYVLRAGYMLSDELARWAKSAGFQFQWKISDDYPIEADAIFEGYLPDVMREVYLTYREQGGLQNARYIPGSKNNVLAFVPVTR